MVGKDKIEITAELKDLLTGQLRNIQAEAAKLDNTLKDVGKDSPMSKKGGFWSKFSNTDMNLMSGVTIGTLAANGITSAANAMIGFGKATVDSLVNYEYFHASLKTMLHGDVQMVGALESQLINLAKSTPFSLVDVQEGTKQLMAYGFQAGDIVKNMKMLGNVSAGVGKPLGELVYLYGTLKTQGKAYTKDLNQFSTAGIPILKELAKQFKTTEANIMDMVSAGKLGFSEIEKAFQNMTEQGGMFFNLMEDQSKTVGGKISAMGDSWEQLKVNIGKSQSGIIAGTIDFFNQMASNINKKQVTTNFLDEAINKYGTGMGKVGIFDKYLGMGGYGDLEKQANYMQQLINMSKTGSDAKQPLALVKKQIDLLQESFNKGWTDKNSYLNEMALYTQTFNAISGNMKLLLKKDDKSETAKENEGKAAKKEVSSLEKVAAANRPTQVNINIENLVREYSNTFNTAAEALKMTPEQVARVLIGAVNDVSNLNYT